MSVVIFPRLTLQHQTEVQYLLYVRKRLWWSRCIGRPWEHDSKRTSVGDETCREQLRAAGVHSNEAMQLAELSPIGTRAAL